MELEPGAGATVVLDVPTHRLALTDRRGVRVVEPGTVDLFVGPDCERPELTATVELTGGVHELTPVDRRVVRVEVLPG